MLSIHRRFLFHLAVALGGALGLLVLGTLWALYLVGPEVIPWMRTRSTTILFLAQVAAVGWANEITIRRTPTEGRSWTQSDSSE